VLRATAGGGGGGDRNGEGAEGKVLSRLGSTAIDTASTDRCGAATGACAACAAAMGEATEGNVLSTSIARAGASAVAETAVATGSGSMGVGSPIAMMAIGRMIAMLSSVTMGPLSITCAACVAGAVHVALGESGADEPGERMAGMGVEDGAAMEAAAGEI